MFPWVILWSGADIRTWMIDNVDCCAVLCFGYLGMIKYGPAIFTKLMGASTVDPAWLRLSMILWNLFLSAFSFFGMLVIVPPLAKTFWQKGWHDTLCLNNDDLLYNGPVGSWMGLFAFSKTFELIDTLWLVIQKKKLPPFLHWYHHVSVLTFAWMSYGIGNSTMAIFAAMNITVHAIMYFYFALCAMGAKKLVRPFAPFITSIQILQMVGGSAVTFYSFVVNFSSYQAGINDVSKLPCGVAKATSRYGCLMYLSYLYLFSEMFVKSYIKKPAPRPRKAE